MPTARVTDKPPYKFPDDVQFPAILREVKVKTIKWNKKEWKNGVATEARDSHGKPIPMEMDKWLWRFEIVGGDQEFVGENGYMETPAEYTTNDGDPVKAAFEALLGAEMEVGDEADTDLLVGTDCWIRFRHDEPRRSRDGSMFYGCTVDEISPREDGEGAAPDPWAGEGQPPF